MLRLKSRQKFIPNGFVFYLPEVKWKPRRMSSFDTIVRELEGVIRANRGLAKKHKWPLERAGVEAWVDHYNALVCAKMGWDDYIMKESGGSVPKVSASRQKELLQSLSAAAAQAKELIRGAKTLTEWVDSGEPAVAAGVAAERASICARCPKNEAVDFTRWFTIPASELIRRQLEKAQARKLATDRDSELNICVACHCPLKLKVHVPIEWVMKRLTPEQLDKMRGVKDCWIVKELSRGCCG